MVLWDGDKSYNLHLKYLAAHRPAQYHNYDSALFFFFGAAWTQVTVKAFHHLEGKYRRPSVSLWEILDVISASAVQVEKNASNHSVLTQSKIKGTI